MTDMGMFDYVIYGGHEFQTKDFECEMQRYYIEGGRLLVSVGHIEDRSPRTAWERDRPGEDPPEEIAGFLGMRGCQTWVEDRREDTEFDGILHFHSASKRCAAKFTEGQLVSVEEKHSA